MLFNKFLYLSTATCIAGMLLSPVFATASQNNQPPRHAQKNQKVSAVGTFKQLASVKGGGENALNYFATGRIPNSNQVVQIRDTGPTPQEWIDIFKGMYELTQTTFNPYTLLEGLDENSQNYGHKLGVFLVYHVTKMYTVYGDEVFDSDFSSVKALSYALNKNKNIDWEDYTYHWLEKWRNNGVRFKQLLTDAGVQVIDSDAKKEWESTFIGEYVCSRPAQTQALVNLKRYMEGDNRVTGQNIERSMNDFHREYSQFALSPNFMNTINDAYKIAKDELKLRSPTYKGHPYFNDKFKDGPVKEHRQNEHVLRQREKLDRELENFKVFLSIGKGFNQEDAGCIVRYIAGDQEVSEDDIHKIFKRAIQQDNVNKLDMRMSWIKQYQEKLKELGVNTRDLPYQDIVSDNNRHAR